MRAWKKVPSRTFAAFSAAALLVFAAGCDEVVIENERESAAACEALPWARGMDRATGVFHCPGTNIPLGSSRAIATEGMFLEPVPLLGLWVAGGIPREGLISRLTFGVELRTCGDLSGFCPGTVPLERMSMNMPPLSQLAGTIHEAVGPLKGDGTFWTGNINNANWLTPLQLGVYTDIVLNDEEGRFSGLDRCDDAFQHLLPQSTWTSLINIWGEAIDPAVVMIDDQPLSIPYLALEQLMTYPRTDWWSPATDLDIRGQVGPPLSDFADALAEEFQTKVDNDSDNVCGDGSPTYGVDNCPFQTNPDQQNSDCDSYGNACDNCANRDNESQADGNHDGVGDACEPITLTANIATSIPRKINALDPVDLSLVVPFELRAVTANAPFGDVEVRFGIYRNNQEVQRGEVSVQEQRARLNLPLFERSRLLAGDYVAKLGAYRETCGRAELISELTYDFAVYRFGFLDANGTATPLVTAFEDLDDDNANGILDASANQPPNIANGVSGDDDYVRFRVEFQGVSNVRWSTASGFSTYARIAKDGLSWMPSAWAVPAVPTALNLFAQGTNVTEIPRQMTLLGTVGSQPVQITAGVTVQSSLCLRDDPNGRQRIIENPWLTNEAISKREGFLYGIPLNVCTLTHVANEPGVRVYYGSNINDARAIELAQAASGALQFGRAAGLGREWRIRNDDSILDIYVGKPSETATHGIAVKMALPFGFPFNPKQTQRERVIVLSETAPLATLYHEIGHYLLPDVPSVDSSVWLSEGAANAFQWRVEPQAIREQDHAGGPDRSFWEAEPFNSAFFVGSPDDVQNRYTAFPLFTYLGDTSNYGRLWDLGIYAQHNQPDEPVPGAPVAPYLEELRQLSWRALGCGANPAACDVLNPAASIAAAEDLVELVIRGAVNNPFHAPFDYADPAFSGLPNLPFPLHEEPQLGVAPSPTARITFGSAHTLQGSTLNVPLHHANGVKTGPTGVTFNVGNANFPGLSAALNGGKVGNQAWLQNAMAQRVCGPNARPARLSFYLASSNGTDGRAVVYYRTPAGPGMLRVSASPSDELVPYTIPQNICIQQGANAQTFKIADAVIYNKSVNNDITATLLWTLSW